MASSAHKYGRGNKELCCGHYARSCRGSPSVDPSGREWYAGKFGRATLIIYLSSAMVAKVHGVTGRDIHRAVVV